MNVKSNPHSTVIIGDRRFDTWKDKQLVKRVEVELATDMSSEATLTVFDPRFRILDEFSTDDGVPELVMRFYMGHGDDLGPPVFKGLLQRVEYGEAASTFIARDMGVKMKKDLEREYHQGLTDLGIIRKLATRRGLGFKFVGSEPALETHESMIQDARMDWEHSMERARAAGFNLFVRQDTLFCGLPAKVSAPILTLRYRKDFELVPAMHGFSLTYKLPENQQGRPKAVHVLTRGRGGRRLTGKSSEHSRGHKQFGRIARDPAKPTKAYVDRRAHAHKELQREPSFNCRISSVPPLPGVRPDVRNTIQLENMGKLFSGPYLCDKVTHTHEGSGTFKTEYNLYRDFAS